MISLFVKRKARAADDADGEDVDERADDEDDDDDDLELDADREGADEDILDEIIADLEEEYRLTPLEERLGRSAVSKVRLLFYCLFVAH